MDYVYSGSITYDAKCMLASDLKFVLLHEKVLRVTKVMLKEIKDECFLHHHHHHHRPTVNANAVVALRSAALPRGLLEKEAIASIAIAALAVAAAVAVPAAATSQCYAALTPVEEAEVKTLALNGRATDCTEIDTVIVLII
uniref:BTB domain-containing protein n=1 Tax=Syphacia muris TaxID=451379 RepID=A0A0N5AQ84_9BILA